MRKIIIALAALAAVAVPAAPALAIPQGPGTRICAGNGLKLCLTAPAKTGGKVTVTGNGSRWQVVREGVVGPGYPFTVGDPSYNTLMAGLPVDRIEHAGLCLDAAGGDPWGSPVTLGACKGGASLWVVDNGFFDGAAATNKAAMIEWLTAGELSASSVDVSGGYFGPAQQVWTLHS